MYRPFRIFITLVENFNMKKYLFHHVCCLRPFF
eukprot:UN10524